MRESANLPSPVRRLGNIRIRYRLGAAFGLLLASAAALVGISLLQMDRASRAAQQLVNTNLRNVALARQAQVAAQESATLLQSLFVLEEREQRVPMYLRIDANTARRDEALQMLLQGVVGADGGALIQQVEKSRDRFVLELERTTELVELSLPAARKVLIADAWPALDHLLESLDALAEHQIALARSTERQIAVLQAQAARSVLAIGIPAIALAMALAWLLSRSITRPLSAAVNLAGAIAEGRLDGPLPAARGDEVGELVNALSSMRSGIANRESRIRDLAFRDPLTGLPNRTSFGIELDRLLATPSGGAACAVGLLDLDRFRHINELLGHGIGDQVLALVACRLGPVIGNAGGLFARFGGDEFAVLLPAAGQAEGEHMLARIIEALRQPLEVEGQLIDVGGSMGMALSPQHGSDRRTLLSRADLALYAAKMAHASWRLFEPRMQPASEHGLSLLSDLRSAIDNDQLELWYQPKIDLRSGSCHAAEALLRWRHPERGMISPGEFIPFAEQTGFIAELTRWTLNRGCRQIAEWRNAGRSIRVSFNLAVRDLEQPGLTRTVAELLRRYGLSPADLCLEITETGIMQEPECARAVLTELHAMGLSLSIDDFGTGYSSLAYLQSLPVSELKIDQSFVRGLAQTYGDERIVGATVSLAHSLGLRVVAEGVESADLVSRLLLLNCDEAQGYHFSRPLPSTEFQAWLDDRARRDRPPGDPTVIQMRLPA